MDAPIANLIIDAFCRGFEEQAKKDEEEAEEIVIEINPDALKALCTRYDNKTGEFPEYTYVGTSVFKFFEELKMDIEKRKEKEEKRTV